MHISFGCICFAALAHGMASKQVGNITTIAAAEQGNCRLQECAGIFCLVSLNVACDVTFVRLASVLNFYDNSNFAV